MKLMKKAITGLMAVTMCASMLQAPVCGIGADIFSETAITAEAAAGSSYMITSTNKVFNASNYTPILQNGSYRLYLSTTGNLVITTGYSATSGYKPWQSNTSCSTNVYSSFKLVLQTDGNLVIYGKLRTTGKDTAIWHTNTYSSWRNTRYGYKFELALQSSGKLWLNYYTRNGSYATTIWRSRY
jgi:hypothetical protein